MCVHVTPFFRAVDIQHTRCSLILHPPNREIQGLFIFFIITFFAHPIYYLRPSVLSLLVITQIRGHIAGSLPPRPHNGSCLAFLSRAENFSSFCPRRLAASNCAYPRQLGPLCSSSSFYLFFLQINSESHHGGIRTHGPTLQIVAQYQVMRYVRRLDNAMLYHRIPYSIYHTPLDRFSTLDISTFINSVEGQNGRRSNDFAESFPKTYRLVLTPSWLSSSRARKNAPGGGVIYAVLHDTHQQHSKQYMLQQDNVH